MLFQSMSRRSCTPPSSTCDLPAPLCLVVLALLVPPSSPCFTASPCLAHAPPVELGCSSLLCCTVPLLHLTTQHVVLRPQSGVTIITISKRLALTEFHSNELQLGAATADGWDYHSIPDDESDEA